MTRSMKFVGLLTVLLALSTFLFSSQVGSAKEEPSGVPIYQCENAECGVLEAKLPIPRPLCQFTDCPLMLTNANLLSKHVLTDRTVRVYGFQFTEGRLEVNHIAYFSGLNITETRWVNNIEEDLAWATHHLNKDNSENLWVAYYDDTGALIEEEVTIP